MQYSLKPVHGYGIKSEKINGSTLVLSSAGAGSSRITGDSFRTYSLAIASHNSLGVPCSLFLGEISLWNEQKEIVKTLNSPDWLRKQPWQMSVFSVDSPYGLKEFHELWLSIITSSRNLDKWRMERIKFHASFKLG